MTRQETLGRLWGERKKGAGRKKDPRSGVSHRRREALATRFPVHVTMKVRRELPKLRRKVCYRVIAEAFAQGCERPGRVFADRYHDRILRTPREVRNVLRYVLNNGRHHFKHFDRHRPDDYSSGAWFDGWKDYTDDGRLGIGPIVRARTWLLGQGWRRHGLLQLLEAPRPG